MRKPHIFRASEVNLKRLQLSQNIAGQHWVIFDFELQVSTYSNEITDLAEYLEEARKVVARYRVEHGIEVPRWH